MTPLSAAPINSYRMKCLKEKILVAFVLLASTTHCSAHAEDSWTAESLIGGRKVQANEIPYHVSLQSNNTHICGGSIISDRHILTAAHCVVNEQDQLETGPIQIAAATNNLNIPNGIRVDVLRIYVPSIYNDSQNWKSTLPPGDIAVLKLNQILDVRNNGNLMKLRLPRPNKRRNKEKFRTYVDEGVVISGFGWNNVQVKTSSNNMNEYEVGSSNDTLNRAVAIVMSNERCQRYYEHNVSDDQVCAKIIEFSDDTPQGVCRGDSGSPLVYNGDTVIGVLSGISLGCDENKEPAIYTRVSSYLTFIRNAMKDVTLQMRTADMAQN
ncbi:hypothetical protein TKK_0016008 [Trichogramma kaykai]|uniref:Peptidase S1 domain-containing protein n=1 Tax=Trichogramma kaykai TaxID=54128 RepID=A0ABD2W9B0_9HYME